MLHNARTSLGQINTYLQMGAAEPTGYEAIAQVNRIREEQEKIKKWREEQKIRLEKKGKIYLQ